jgi:iron complex transport system ATP-binding protein
MEGQVSRIAVTNVTVAVQTKRLVDDFSLRVEPGEIVALLGPNGAGKTTLLRCILGLVRPSSGQVLLNGVETLTLGARQRAALVAHLAQHAARDEMLSVLEYVAAARFRHDESRAMSLRAATAALKRVDAEGLAERRMGPLSGGEYQRVALAALLAQEARVLLLDEPANHLDPARQAQSYTLLGELQQAGQTLVIVTHDVNLLAHLASSATARVVGMRQGQCTFDMPYGDDRLCAALADLYGVPMSEFQHEGHRLIVPSTARGA